MNYWMNPSGTYMANVIKMNNKAADKFFPKYASAKGSLTPVFADSNWVGGWPENDQVPPPTDVTLEDPALKPPEGLGRFCINRHRGAVNIAYADCSVRRVPLVELWLQYWCRGSRPNTRVGPINAH